VSNPYVVVAWEGPLPPSDKAARDRYEELVDAYFAVDAPSDSVPRHRPPTQAIADLVSALLRRWPEQHDTETPWIEGPLASMASGPMIEIPLEDSDALPFIARECRRLGLVCFDVQGPPHLVEPAVAEQTVASIQIGLRQAVSDALVTAGYKRAGHGLHTRPIDHDFCIVVDTGAPSRQADAVSPFVGLHSHRVGDLESALIEVPADKEGFMTVGTPLGYWFGPSFAGVEIGATSQFGDAQGIVARIEDAASRLLEFAHLERLPGYSEHPQHYIRRLSIAILVGDVRGMAGALADAERECIEHEGLCDQYRRVAANAAARIGPEVEREVQAAKAELVQQAAPATNDRRGLLRRFFRSRPARSTSDIQPH